MSAQSLPNPNGNNGHPTQRRVIVCAGTGCVASGAYKVFQALVAQVRAAGIPVRDYGCGLSVHELVERSRTDRTQVLLVSALMLRSAMRIKHLVAALRTAELPVKVVAGGAPFVFDRRLAEEVGADAVGYNASDALVIVRRLLGGKS